MANFEIITGDALVVLHTVPEASIDCIVTSPRYNFGKNYGPEVNDNTSMADYFEEMNKLAVNLFRVVKPIGALFLNVGTRSANPIHDVAVAQEFMKAGWVMQERIIWLKATDDAGHFTPITSDTHLNNLWESVFLFTKTGKVVLDRLAIGVPYKDETNIRRWKKAQDVRCRGDVWFLPYKTITNRARDRKGHEATFPRELVVRCLRLVEWGRQSLRVLDPCCGTGTVPFVAAELGHHGLGIEINPIYAEMATRHIESAIPGPASELSAQLGDLTVCGCTQRDPWACMAFENSLFRGEGYGCVSEGMRCTCPCHDEVEYQNDIQAAFDGLTQTPNA